MPAGVGRSDAGECPDVGLDTGTVIIPGNSLQRSPDGKVHGWEVSPLLGERFQQWQRALGTGVPRSCRDGVSKPQYVTSVPAHQGCCFKPTQAALELQRNCSSWGLRLDFPGWAAIPVVCSRMYHQKIRKCHFFCSVFLPLSDIKCFCIVASGFYQAIFFSLCFVF